MVTEDLKLEINIIFDDIKGPELYASPASNIYSPVNGAYRCPLISTNLEISTNDFQFRNLDDSAITDVQVLM